MSSRHRSKRFLGGSRQSHRDIVHSQAARRSRQVLMRAAKQPCPLHLFSSHHSWASVTGRRNLQERRWSAQRGWFGTRGCRARTAVLRQQVYPRVLILSLLAADHLRVQPCCMRMEPCLQSSWKSTARDTLCALCFGKTRLGDRK